MMPGIYRLLFIFVWVWLIFNMVLALGVQTGYQADSLSDTSIEWDGYDGDAENETAVKTVEAVLPPLIAMAEVIAIPAYFVSFVVPRVVMQFILMAILFSPTLLVARRLINRPRPSDDWIEPE